MNITEKEFIEYFSKKFGDNPVGRLKYLLEEVGECFEALVDCNSEGAGDEQFEHLKDEACDVYSIALHLIHTVGLNHQEAMNNTWDKVKGREIKYHRYYETSDN